MKRNSAELKRLARQHLKGRFGIPLGALVVYNVSVSLVLNIFSRFLNIYSSIRNLLLYQLVSILVGLLGTLFVCGLYRIHLSLARGQMPVFTDLFSCFRRRPDRFLLADLIQIGIALVCMIPCFVCLSLGYLYDALPLLALALLLALGGLAAAIVALLPLSLVLLLLTDHDEMGVTEALQESIRLMQGNWGRYFYLQLSFLGLALLGVLSCYIGLLWVRPYITQTMVEFYREASGEMDRPVTEAYSNG